jgi:thymidine phosphorylase
MLPQEIIRKKRDGGVLDPEEIAFFVEGMSAGRISEGQAAAFAMAVYFRGMTRSETVALTLAKSASGRRLDWDDLGPVVDKHSTGGIGDKVSLILAPILAACDAYVPMISGRGLGHTGGTLDKLDSIPGYDTAPDLERLRAAVRTAGCAIIGQTAELAPADRRLYAIRDVTATVESAPLIVASILSKKLAAGLNALVMDVKVGSGAFLPSLDEARGLARNLVEVANDAGLPCRAVLTGMDQCLGHSAGNALEVHEAIAMLTGTRKDTRLQEVTLVLSGALLLMAGLANDPGNARARVQGALDSGAAAERFARMVSALGGPHDLVERPARHLPASTVQRAVHLPWSGTIASIDARALGVAIIALGGGRTNPAAAIDHAVGLTEVVGLGQQVDADRPFAIVHARSEADLADAMRAIVAAVRVGEAPTTASDVVIETIEPDGSCASKGLDRSGVPAQNPGVRNEAGE